MTGESFFLDIAKVSITIAGFTGLVAALRHPRDVGWDANEIAGLKLMFEHSLAAVVLGLLPSVVYFYAANEQTVWQFGSVLLALFLVYEMLAEIARIKHVSAAGTPPRKFLLLLFAFFLPAIVVLVLQVQNITTWRAPAGYAGGLLWLIIATLIQFLVFLSHIKPTEP